MANFNFNMVILGGRLTSDPELKQTQSGVSVCTFNIAVNRYAKSGEDQKADFFRVIAWRNVAEHSARYFKKGMSISIVGSMQTSSWVDRQDVKHYNTDVVASEVRFVDSKNESSIAKPDQLPAFSSLPTARGEAVPKFEELGTEDDLPF